jgi:hypothetical protein
MPTADSYTADLARTMGEGVLLSRVRQVAQLRQWLGYHTHRSDRSDAGFPDLVLVRDERVIYAELKTERGRVTPEQRRWLDTLAGAGVEVYLWRPAHYLGGHIDRVLEPRGCIVWAPESRLNVGAWPLPEPARR